MRAILALALLLSLPALATDELEIIPLRHRSAEQLVPLLEPLLGPGARLSGMGERLLLRAPAAERKRVREALAALDVPLRRLMITVRQENELDTRDEGAGLSARIGGGEAAARARSYGTRGRAQDRIAQQVQVVEGASAYIASGSSIPLPLREVVVGSGGVVVSDSVLYRDLSTGFYARPTLNGDRVTVEIAPRQEFLSEGAAVRSSRLSTTVSGRLGEWIPLGASSGGAQREAGGAASYSTRGRLEQGQVLLKVEALPE